MKIKYVKKIWNASGLNWLYLQTDGGWGMDSADVRKFDAERIDDLVGMARDGIYLEAVMQQEAAAVSKKAKWIEQREKDEEEE